MPQDPSLAPLVDATRTHFLQKVMPLWLGPGWDAELALPYEALDASHAPLPPQRYRAMACARQLYLFASHIDQPGARERAAALFRSLQRHFHDAEHGGWFYSIDPQGQPLDRSKDLYTHAFIIFACAHYWAAVSEPLVESVLDAALEIVATRFASEDDLYASSLAEDWADNGSGALQNPLMHLTEAFLATLAVRDDEQVKTDLLALADAMQRHFIEPVRGLMLEKPCGAVDNWFEPGHQFEWFYLLESCALMHDHPLRHSVARCFAFSEQFGVQDGVVLSMLEPDGRVRDGTRRIWAQAEYLRALTLRGDAQPRVAQQLKVFREKFLHADGWYECRDAEGKVSRSDMPSTTPYHLETCYKAL
ncbi:AGE family epimerase/isomerase [Pseudomonas sp. dw_358]|uniref:AGE family epimerase/isomerase n=1 Tax=Pseudomonas sp. dw_358 TaxID=2720083 RepID=UPI001BD461D7|nr:AGE family epimerase/isomerase [Pseudomonas sp. dw_358]